jgi:regulator of sirC expression with transglutaminase-like and TPR domain
MRSSAEVRVHRCRYRRSMSETSRERLVRLVRRNDADLAEAALLCGVETDPDLDVDATLLRIDALTDVLRTRGAPTGNPETDARQLAAFLAGELGFRGDVASYHDPDNALLHRVLDTRRGLPITLAIVYVAIARRLGLPAYAVNLPGHVVAAIAGGDRPVVIDPFHDGIVLDEQAVAARIATVTGGQVDFRRSMLRPAPAVDVVRRLLNNLTRDLSAATHPGKALWTVEVKLLLPNRVADDHRVLGELLAATGRFDAAADAYERYLELAGDTAPDREPVRRAAIQARARLN